MIETEHLQILPLTPVQLEVYLQADGKLERLIHLTVTGRTVAPDVQEMVKKFTIPKMKVATADNYLYYTFWIVVEKSTKIIVAELGFKGEPNDMGFVEIGYGTMPGQRKKGFMTEAVGAMISWAKAQPGIFALLAETDETNIASIKVVQKNNFQFVEKKEQMLMWKIACK